MNSKMTIHVSAVAVCAILATAAVATTAATAKEFCSVDKSKWQPQSLLVKKLESQGWKIRNMKIDGGCYEVYGTDGNGKPRETHFNPATLEPVAEAHKG